MADQDEHSDANGSDAIRRGGRMDSNDANSETQEDDLVKKIQDLKKGDEKTVHETYQEQIQELTRVKDEAESKALRAVADLHNAQRRMEEEKSSFSAFAAQKLVLQVLEIYENYHRLLEHEPEGLDAEWKKGFELIDWQFQSFLDQQGVSLMEVKEGDQIDPAKHEVMMTGEGDVGKILEIFSQGYEMRGRVIKTAKVKVGHRL
ncbi:MAG: nucleotide exchange factor GrpE [bacterium]|nr:nucleotide exchange factor GrpE [bacterium]